MRAAQRMPLRRNATSLLEAPYSPRASSGRAARAPAPLLSSQQGDVETDHLSVVLDRDALVGAVQARDVVGAQAVGGEAVHVRADDRVMAGVGRAKAGERGHPRGGGSGGGRPAP